MLQRICHLLRFQPPVADNRGLLFLSGATVPTDGTDGYQTGCLFLHTDGGVGTAVYINEGSVTSCAFNAIEGLESITIADLEDVADGFTSRLLETGTYQSTASGGVVLSSSNTRPFTILTDDGGANLDSGNYRPFLSRTLLTIDQTGSTITPVRGQLKINDLIDVGTGIYAPVQGYIEVAGTSIANSGATLSCISASLEITTALTAASSGEVAGVHIETTGAGTLTATGTVAGLLIDKASGAADWPVGISVLNATTAINIGACTTAIAAIDKVVLSPDAAGTMLDFVLETEWASGTLVRADFGGSTTLTGATIGAQFDLGTNIVATSEQSVTGVSITLPQSTNDAASPDLRGVVVAVSGAMTAATSGDPTFTGVEITTPAIDCTLDTITSLGVHVTTGQITQTGGTAISAAYKATGGTVTSGTAHGIFIDGTFSTGITVAATVTTGISVAGGTVGTGLSIGACTTAAVHILGDQAIGILFDVDASATDGLKMSVDTSMTLTEGIEISGAGTVTTGITLAMDLSTTGILISAAACVTGISITAGSLTDGIKVSATTPEDGVEVSSACTQAAFHVSAASASGLLVSGACTTAAINITAANLNCIKSVFNVGAQLGQYVQGIKMEHTRSADIQPSTGGWWGAQIVLNAGTGYTALDKTAYVLHCIFKGDATDPSAQTVNVARFETQSNGKVEDLLFVSANAGSTVEGDVARFVAHVAPTRAILAVQNGTVGSTPMGVCIDIDETMTTGIQFNTGAALTNLLQITAAANTSYFLLVDAEAGCVPNYSSAGSAIANLKVKIGSTDGYIKIYDAA